MTTNVPDHVDVAIVGAGPAGLAAACALRKHHINAIVLDTAREPTTYSKATIIHARTLEVLEAIDVTKQVLAEGVTIKAFNAWSRNSFLTSLEFGKMKGTRYPMTVGLPQSRTERMLLARLAELGGVVLRGAEVTSMTESRNEDGSGCVRLQVTGSAGSRTTLEASYVIAADGLHSSLRKWLGIPFKGGDYSASMLAADCRLTVKSEKFRLQSHEACLCFANEGFVLFQAQTPDIWRVLAPLDKPPKDATLEDIQKIIDDRAPAGVKIDKLIWSDRFRIHHRHAATYRKGHVFLIGDAAHTFSPAGGQGMNAGIQDGIELAEVLRAAIIDYEDSDADLDRYESVRRPVVKNAISMTHKLMVVGQWKSAWARHARDWFVGLFMQISGVQLKANTRLAALEK